MECRANVLTMPARLALPRWTLLLLLPLVAAACARPPARPVRVGLIAWGGYEGLLLAERRGSEEEMPVQVIRYSSASEVIRALGAGQIEAGALTADEALLAASLHPQTGLRIAAVLDFSNGADAILARPPLARFADLRLRVGVEAYGGGGYPAEPGPRARGPRGRRRDPGFAGLLRTPGCLGAGRGRRHRHVRGGARPYRGRGWGDGLRLEGDPGRASRCPRGARHLTARSALRSPPSGRLVPLARPRLARPDSVALESPADLGISPDEYRETTALLDQPDLERNRLLMTPGPAGLEPVLARIASALQAHRLAGPIPPPGSLLDPGLLPAAP
ncbi:MAG: hypothetical protein IPK12_12630 [Gemmatimonadetes bacterium]|nr:hypothetical protein [Gemmatimonadota bacterium]